MKSPCLDLSLVSNPSIFFPEGREADAVEAHIDALLPKLPSLTFEMSSEERVTFFKQTAARQRAVFVAINGNPFGDSFLVPRPKKIISSLFAPQLNFLRVKSDS